MRTSLGFIGVVLLLAAGPGQAGFFDDFDITQLTNHLRSGGPPRDGIPAMTNPLAVDPDQVDYVADGDLVLGVYLNGEAKAYPENLGWWHEIVNDEVGGQFVSVTLCPLTGTGQVFNATDGDGKQIEFGVSGLLINSNLVMYDRRDNETLYPQMIYTGISGAFEGERLELLPVVETTWAMWQRLHPDTKVAQRGTGLERYSDRSLASYDFERYVRYPYQSTDRESGELNDYRTTNDWLIFAPSTITLSSFEDFDQRYAIKDVVLGVCFDDVTKAYPFLAMPDRAVLNDVVGGLPLVVLFDRDSDTAIPYVRWADDRELTFYQVPPQGDLPVEFMDMETGSRWNMLGRAIDGPLAGAQLEQMPAYNSMWFAWTVYWTDTLVWDGEGILEAPADTAVEDGETVPDEFGLGQNFPNPFNPRTQLQYTLPVAGQVRLTIFNAAGQTVRTLVQGHRQAGLYLQQWDGRDQLGRAVSSGAYMYRLEMPEAGFSQTRTMTLVR